MKLVCWHKDQNRQLALRIYANQTACPACPAFNQEKALVGAFSVIVKSPVNLRLKLCPTPRQHRINHPDTSHLRCFALNTLNTGHRPLGAAGGSRGTIRYVISSNNIITASTGVTMPLIIVCLCTNVQCWRIISVTPVHRIHSEFQLKPHLVRLSRLE